MFDERVQGGFFFHLEHVVEAGSVERAKLMRAQVGGCSVPGTHRQAGVGGKNLWSNEVSSKTLISDFCECI